MKRVGIYSGKIYEETENPQECCIVTDNPDNIVCSSIYKERHSNCENCKGCPESNK